METHSRTRSSASEDDGGPPSKIRRVTRACLQCRSRKQRCLPFPRSHHDTQLLNQAPCQRCRQLNTTCSFETDRPAGLEENPTPSKMATMVVELQRRVNAQEERIVELERITRASLEKSAEEVDGAEEDVGNGVNVADDVDVFPDQAETLPIDASATAFNSYEQPDFTTSPHAAHQPSVRPTSNTTPLYAPPTSVSPSAHTHPDFTMSTLEIGPPIATLRSLGALSTDQPESTPPGNEGRSDYRSSLRRQDANPDHRHHHTHRRQPSASGCDRDARATAQGPVSVLDPIARGVMSVRDATTAIDTFFKHCHSFGPVLDEKLKRKGVDMRFESPTLFLAICTIGARFWEYGASKYKSGSSAPDRDRIRPRGLHPSFLELTTLLDISVSQLLLRPTPSDVTLDSIRALLLYAQWMPVNRDNQPQHFLSVEKPTARSRYNDISAWAVLGLAARYALFLGLDRLAVVPFQSANSTPFGLDHRQGDGQPITITESDMSRLRVWHNLITCDCNLMLTSGLPASLDPGPAVAIGKVFASHESAQQPGDLRVTALVELVGIAHRAIESNTRVARGATGTGSGPGVGRVLEASCLRKANFELDEWEASWLGRLKDTAYQYNALPFTSVRWYRLSLNSAALGPLLSPVSATQSAHHTQQRNHLSSLQSLEVSLTAASQILFAHCKQASAYIWSLDSQNPSSFPPTDPIGSASTRDEGFAVDEEAVERLSYAVDYTWISLTFAVTFLILCYVRGTVDDDLGISILSTTYSNNTRHQTHFAHPARPTSILARLVCLAQDIFDRLCRTSTVHPARDFQPIVNNAAALVLASSPPAEIANGVPARNTDWRNVDHPLNEATISGVFGNSTGVAPNGQTMAGSTMGDGQGSSLGEGDPDGLQGLFDLMSSSGMDWPGYLFGGVTGGGTDMGSWDASLG
ncbi:hypothetical protein IAR55_004069 [Kwoniella newhampshirensis]|uniref:Zn(2)-C6 fungal-type domain-containing protein n=1 Tax=Kwoniella newhampshirensis TaxID=1651941 RepID=A0AAW0Z199_9TREE